MYTQHDGGGRDKKAMAIDPHRADFTSYESK